MEDTAAKVLATGQSDCYDEQGQRIDCAGTGQDGAIRAGLAAPATRFERSGEVVRDRLSGLVWPRDAALSEFPLMWQEAFDFVAAMNSERRLGYSDWRLPSRAELLSLLCYQQTRPPLPKGHPFRNLFAGWYWSSTTAVYQPAHAWYLDMDGGRLFFGGKEQSFMVWPVRGESELIWQRQNGCFDTVGRRIDCRGSGQDGAYPLTTGAVEPRFLTAGEVVHDGLTGLEWTRYADLAQGAVSWVEALERVNGMAGEASRPWRLPNIKELESLVDYDQACPALPQDIPFESLQPGYWSSTTSVYEPDWAWALYLDKGAVGVGQKQGRHFHVMAVRDAHGEGVASGTAFT